MIRTPGEVLEFWFCEQARPRWFANDAGFDDEIRRRFAATLAAAAAGRLDGWTREPQPCLALVIVLDQVSRNVHRGSPRAYATDAAARAVATTATDRGFDRAVPLDRRIFFYLPFEHSEDPEDQRRSVALFRQWAGEHTGAARDKAFEQLDHVLRRQDIIERFGRFPHRNAILGRPATAEESEFLKEPNSSF